jgi:hypothetical protein
VDGSRDRLDRLTTREAADLLDITEAGVGKRVQRGQIPHERDDTGRLWVYLDPRETDRDRLRDRDREARDSPERDALITELRAHNATLREQLESERQAHSEARRLLAAALERIPPQLEPPPETREAPDTPTEEAERPATGGSQEGAQRPWSSTRGHFGRLGPLGPDGKVANIEKEATCTGTDALSFSTMP